MALESPQQVGLSGAQAITDGLRIVYQPVVDLRSGGVVGFEALARGRAGGGLERPDLLFAAAHDHGLTAELDWACRAGAFEGALAAGLRPPTTLFVNVEPDAVDVPCPPQFVNTIARARQGLWAVFEVTERDLANKPAQLLRVVERIRAQGFGIALDDVGVDWRSLALMAVIRPDVLKLDMHMVQSPLNDKDRLVVEAVKAYAARSGAHILAEGIETDAHLRMALSLGATFGQGWKFGRPAPLPALSPEHQQLDPLMVVGRQPVSTSTPMDAIEDIVPMTIAAKGDLLEISRSIEYAALAAEVPCLILSVFQTVEHFTPPTARLYAELASHSAFVGAFGHGMPREPAPGVRGASLPDNHRLMGQWSVIVAGPHYTEALIAQDLGDDCADMSRRFRYAVVSDRSLVLRAARALMLKMSALERLVEPRPVAADLG